MATILRQDTDGTRLTIMTVGLPNLKDDRLEKLGDSVLKVYTSSKAYAARCRVLLNTDADRRSENRDNDAFNVLVQRYFGRTLKGMTSGERSTMRLVMLKAAEGLQLKDQTIVVSRGSDDAAGSVESKLYTGDLPKDPVKKLQTMHEKGIKTALEPASWRENVMTKEFKWQRNLVESRGHIHINPQWIDPGDKSFDFVHSCVTLIHEATHKYADTWDYCYFQHGGLAGPKTPEPGRFDATTPGNRTAHHGKMDDMTRHYVRNADSYGYLAYFAGSAL